MPLQQLTAIRALRPKDDPNHDAFLEHFYNEAIVMLFAPVMTDVPDFKAFVGELLHMHRLTRSNVCLQSRCSASTRTTPAFISIRATC